MTPDELKAELAQLAEENQRLREALDYIAIDGCSQKVPCAERFMRDKEATDEHFDYSGRFAESDFCNPCLAKLTLAQPAPTTGLLDVVRAAVKFKQTGGMFSANLWEAGAEIVSKVGVLTPATLEMLEVGFDGWQ